MNISVLKLKTPLPCALHRAITGTTVPKESRTGRRAELFVFLLLLALFNVPVLRGSFAAEYVFLPARVAAGEWWRLFTHCFVHVSWYHLLLDGTAFLMLYHGLIEKSSPRRLGLVLGGVLGSVSISWAFAPTIATQGLCGLSGAAHGLMAVSALELLAMGRLNSAPGRIGLFCLLLVLMKAGTEAVTGKMFFPWLHFGLVGTPIATSHAGGIIGSLFVLAFQLRRPALYSLTHSTRGSLAHARQNRCRVLGRSSRQQLSNPSQLIETAGWFWISQKSRNDFTNL